ncbi:MAG: dephospho-CoA kinase [Acholeplasma sp.]|nr:dephospho-CoA kinase [Acholeplasma sp.]
MKNVKNKPMIYGLTGGIASGKTTALNYFIEKGIKVVDSDLIVKALWCKNNELINYVNQKFNLDIKSTAGKKKLADLIFNDVNIKKEIDNLVHPLVFKEIDEWVKKNKSEKILIIDMPLLFEVEYQDKVDKTILIATDMDLQIERLMKRDNVKYNDAIKRINSQMATHEKIKKADFIIYNNDNKEILLNRLTNLWEVIKHESE